MAARGRSPSSFSDGQDSVVESTTSTAFVPPPIQRIKTISSNFSLPAAGRTLGKGFKRLGDLVEKKLLYPEPDIGNTPQALAMIKKFNRQWENGTKFKPSQLQQICGSLSLCLSESDEAVKLEALQCIIGLMKQEKALCVLFVSHKAYIQFEGLLRQPESLEVTKAAADAYLLLFRQLLSFPDNFRSELKDAMKLMMALETESSGIEGIGLVLSDQRLDEISRQLLDFSRATEKNDSGVAMQYFAIRCITALASRDRYCVASLERVNAQNRLDNIDGDNSGKDVILHELIKDAKKELHEVHTQLLPTWKNVSQIHFKVPKIYAALLRIGDSREPDQHWFAGRMRRDGRYQYGRISWNHQRNILSVPAHRLDIQLQQITGDDNVGQSSTCEALMGTAPSVRWLDVPVGQPFTLGAEHSPFVAGENSGEKPAYVAIFTVPGSNRRWNVGYIQEGMTQAQQDWSFGLGGNLKCTAVKVLVCAF